MGVLGVAGPGVVSVAGASPASDRGGVILRTPTDRFRGLPDYPFAPRYVTVNAGTGLRVRLHYVDERPANPAAESGETIVLLHGNPSWSYLYRHVIPPLVAAGHRCIAPDLIGFGKSDKLRDRFLYTYQNHVDWLRSALFDQLGLRDVTLVCHDWGGKLGLRLVADHPDRFKRIVASNTGLETGDEQRGPAWQYLALWIQQTQRVEHFDPADILEAYTSSTLDPAVRAAYSAPYTTDPHLHGVRRFGLLIPVTGQDENSDALRGAWAVLGKLRTPFLCVFSDEDHIFHGDHSGLSNYIPGAQGQSHPTIRNAAHFVQEDQPAAFAAAVSNFIRTAG